MLQVREHEANSELAERNRIKTVPIPAPRGKILDRDGRVIVDNAPSVTLMLTQENLKLEHLDAIARGLHLDLEELRAQVKRYTTGPQVRPHPGQGGTDARRARLRRIASRRRKRFRSWKLIETPRRLYPQDGLAAHVIGYVGEVSEDRTEYARIRQVLARRQRRQDWPGAPV